MDSGFYAAYAGLAARMQALDVMASNLANASTSGFKAQEPFYRALTAAWNGAPLSPLNQAINRFGLLGGSRTDLRSGSLDPTGNRTDLAVEGSAFFSVQTQAGIRYTRNGSFEVDSQRRLVTQQGDAVLAEQGNTTIPIVLPTGDVTVSSDGTVSVNGGLAAKLHMVEFAPGTPLTPEGNANFAAPAGSEQTAADSHVREGMLETSNLSPGGRRGGLNCVAASCGPIEPRALHFQYRLRPDGHNRSAARLALIG